MKKKRENCFKRKKLYFDEFVWHLILGFWILGIFIASGIEGGGKHYYDLAMLVKRKGAHVFEFFILTYLFWKVLSFYSLKFWQQICLTFLFSFFCASWDEVHQLFVFGREGKIEDIFIDLVGIFLLLLVIFFVEKKTVRKKAI